MCILEYVCFQVLPLTVQITVFLFTDVLTVVSALVVGMEVPCH